MALILRMGLYAVFAGLAGFEIGSFNELTGDYTINIEDVKEFLLYVGGFIGTFVWSRIAKARGGKT